jgi:hypothetical protein
MVAMVAATATVLDGGLVVDGQDIRRPDNVCEHMSRPRRAAAEVLTAPWARR